MQVIYSFFLYLMSPYLLLRLWIKGRKSPAYKRNIADRFAYYSKNYPPVDIWVHAVSLGEVIAATPLIEALLTQGKRVLVTNMTPTGAQKTKQQFGERVLHCYIPYDLPGAMKRFYQKMQPKVGIIIETELWPNLIREAKKAAIPLLLVNARLSVRSKRGYQRIRFFIKKLLNQFEEILPQTAQDAAHFIELGAEPSRVKTLGNIKFDAVFYPPKRDVTDFKKTWGGDARVVVIAASTHYDEEEQVLSEWRTVQRAIPNVLLLIAPRHPERFQNVAILSQSLGFKTVLRSETTEVITNPEVVILDCLGELLSFYKLSDFAFVGGSLVSVGGHNILEPIALEVPVLSGTHVFNFSALCKDLEQAGAITFVKNAQELAKELIALYQEPLRKEKQVQQAKEILLANKGALERNLERIGMYTRCFPSQGKENTMNCI